MAIKSMSIRIDDKMLNKLHAVADYEAARPTAKFSSSSVTASSSSRKSTARSSRANSASQLSFLPTAKSEVERYALR